MLIGKILHSPHPHARILKIDTSRALALPGVVAVVVGTDAPNKYGILPVGHDETALAVDKVRYVGDNVACVVAESEGIAQAAIELVDVEYEILPAWFDPEKSMLAEENLIHEQKPHNLEKDYHHVFGDPDKGFAEAEAVVEGRYIANEVTHAAMEPHSTLASFETDPQTGNPGRLIIWSSTQVPYYLQHKLSIVLDMPMSQIRVIKPLVGGGFGGKSEVIPIEIIAAVAARKAKAPVKITYTREEVFWAHRGRPRTIIDLKTGVKKDGKICAVAAKVIQDGGAYCSYGIVTILYSGALLGALYDIPNIRYDGYRVLTNKPACGAMRGHGTVNVRFAFESQFDEARRKDRHGPRGNSPAQFAARSKHHCERAARAELRLAGMYRRSGDAFAMERAQRQAPARARAGHRVQPLRKRRGEFDYSFRHAAFHGEYQNRSRRRRSDLYGRVGYRAGLRHDGGANRG